MTNQTAASEAARDVDWMQVLLNLLNGQETRRDGQPCFWIDPDGIEPRFCLRAKFWAGHGDEHGHEFISLEKLLDSFARVEVLRGRVAESDWWAKYHGKDHNGEGAKRRSDLQAQLKEAEEGANGK